jgi:hypothetical protein
MPIPITASSTGGPSVLPMFPVCASAPLACARSGQRSRSVPAPQRSRPPAQGPSPAASARHRSGSPGQHGQRQCGRRRPLAKPSMITLHRPASGCRSSDPERERGGDADKGHPPHDQRPPFGCDERRQERQETDVGEGVGQPGYGGCAEARRAVDRAVAAQDGGGRQVGRLLAHRPAIRGRTRVRITAKAAIHPAWARNSPDEARQRSAKRDAAPDEHREGHAEEGTPERQRQRPGPAAPTAARSASGWPRRGRGGTFLPARARSGTAAAAAEAPEAPRAPRPPRAPRGPRAGSAAARPRSPPQKWIARP